MHAHATEAGLVINFLDENESSNRVKTFAKESISLLSNSSLTETQKFEQFKSAYDIYDPLLPQTVSQTNYEAKIREYATEFRRRGKAEFANYLESILPFEPSTTMGEISDVYEVIREEKVKLSYDYFTAIFTATAESFKPVIQVALIGVGGGLALQLLKKIPSAYVTINITNIITRLGIPASTAFTAFQHAQKFGIQTYAQLQQLFVNLSISATSQGVHFHHLIEQRFVGNSAVQNWLGSSTAAWKSIVLTPQEHQVFTNAWRQMIGYGNTNGSLGVNTSSATLTDIKEAARQIYVNYPEILEALGL